MTTREAVDGYYRVASDSQKIVRLERHARASLAALYHKLGFTTGAELGVWSGDHADILCQYNPGLELLCIDAWEDFARQAGHPMPSEFVRVRRRAERKLAQYPGVRILKMFNEDAAALVPDGALDFIFVDASHAYKDVLQDLTTWSPKVRSGGIISGHDYETTALGWPPENGVKQAVHDFLDARGIRPLYLLMGTARDRWKSYFWVQP